MSNTGVPFESFVLVDDAMRRAIKSLDPGGFNHSLFHRFCGLSLMTLEEDILAGDLRGLRAAFTSALDVHEGLRFDADDELREDLLNDPSAFAFAQSVFGADPNSPDFSEALVESSRAFLAERPAEPLTQEQMDFHHGLTVHDAMAKAIKILAPPSMVEESGGNRALQAFTLLSVDAMMEADVRVMWVCFTSVMAEVDPVDTDPAATEFLSSMVGMNPKEDGFVTSVVVASQMFLDEVS